MKTKSKSHHQQKRKPDELLQVCSFVGRVLLLSGAVFLLSVLVPLVQMLAHHLRHPEENKNPNYSVAMSVAVIVFLTFAIGILLWAVFHVSAEHMCAYTFFELLWRALF